MTWHENNLYNPNAIAEQLRAESVRSPAVRLGGGVYGGIDSNIIINGTPKRKVRKPGHPGSNDVQAT